MKWLLIWVFENLQILCCFPSVGGLEINFFWMERLEEFRFDVKVSDPQIEEKYC